MTNITRLLSVAAVAIAALAALVLASPSPASADGEPALCAPDYVALTTEEWEQVTVGMGKRQIIETVGFWGERVRSASTRTVVFRAFDYCHQGVFLGTTWVQFDRADDGHLYLANKD